MRCENITAYRLMIQKSKLYNLLLFFNVKFIFGRDLNKKLNYYIIQAYSFTMDNYFTNLDLEAILHGDYIDFNEDPDGTMDVEIDVEEIRAYLAEDDGRVISMVISNGDLVPPSDASDEELVAWYETYGEYYFANGNYPKPVLRRAN